MVPDRAGVDTGLSLGMMHSGRTAAVELIWHRKNVESCAKSVQLSTSTETGSHFRLIDSCITQLKA